MINEIIAIWYAAAAGRAGGPRGGRGARSPIYYYNCVLLL